MDSQNNSQNNGFSQAGLQFNPENNKQPKLKKRYWKFIFGFLGIIFVVLVGYPSISYYYNSYMEDKAIRTNMEMMNNYTDALRRDTFGGATPQETYEMFITTLKSGNILAAAKFYADDEDRVDAYKKFDQMQKAGTLANWIAKLPNWSQMKEVKYWDPDGKEFDYEYFRNEDEKYYDELLKKWDIIPAGKYTGSIIFKINKLANIWKIYEL